MDAVVRALEKTHVSADRSSGVSFEGKNIKWDSANDAQSLIDAINACRNLEYLNLAGNTLGVEAAEVIALALEKHPEFKQALWKDLFTGRLKAEIPKALSHLGNGLVNAGARLTVLDLSDNAFGPIGVKGLASLLRSPSCYNLQELRLNNNGLGISGGKLLANALMTCYNSSKEVGKPLALQVFIAGRNRLENEGAKALAEVFKTIGTFEEIAMPQNGIYYPGITALSEAFSTNTNLKIINLNDNTIGPKGALALSKSLPTLQQLSSLNFGDCLLKTKGATHIANAIKDGHLQLEELILDFNEIRADGGIAIAKAMKNKVKLRRLMLDGNQFGDEGKESIERELKNSGKWSALSPMDENESEQSEDEDEDRFEEEEEEEEEIDEDGIDDDQEIPELEKVTLPAKDERPVVTITQFVESPTLENFQGLGNDRTDKLLKEFKDVNDDIFLDKFVPVLMKVSALAGNNREDIAKLAIETSNSLYKILFEWALRTNKTSLMNNALLIHLGLIKCEDKKYKPVWNTDGCMLALESAVKQNYFLSSTKDTLRVFMDSPREAATQNIEDVLISGVQAIALNPKEEIN